MKSPLSAITRALGGGTFAAPPLEPGTTHAERHGRTLRGANSGRGDRADWLPSEAARRLRRLRGDAENVRASTRALSDQRFELFDIRRDAQQRLKELQRDYAPATAEAAIAEAMGRIETADAAIAEIDERIEGLKRRVPAPLQRVETWLLSLSADLPIEPVEAVEPAYKKNETFFGAIERFRGEIQSKKVELAGVRNAPLPSADVKSNIRREIEALAERGRPNFLPAIDLGDPIKWPQVAHQNFGGKADTSRPTIGAVSGGGRGPDAIGILCWANRDAMIAAAEREIDELAEDEHAMSEEARAMREAELLAAIFQLELAECKAVEESDGEQYRADVDPRALLGLSSNLPAPRR